MDDAIKFCIVKVNKKTGEIYRCDTMTDPMPEEKLQRYMEANDFIEDENYFISIIPPEQVEGYVHAMQICQVFKVQPMTEKPQAKKLAGVTSCELIRKSVIQRMD